MTSAPDRAGLTATLLLQGTATPAYAQRPIPFRLDPVRESVLLQVARPCWAPPSAWADLEVLTVEEIAALDPADVNAFDRGATSRWSPTAPT